MGRKEPLESGKVQILTIGPGGSSEINEEAYYEQPRSHGISREYRHQNCKQLIIRRAGEGNRTLVSSLGSSCSTIELHPRRRRRNYSAELTKNFLLKAPPVSSVPSFHTTTRLRKDISVAVLFVNPGAVTPLV